MEEYEAGRAVRRLPRHMVQSAVSRRSYLKNVCGFSDDEVIAATKDAQAAKSKRNTTKALDKVHGLEVALSSVGRKFKRAVSKKSKDKKERDDHFVKQFTSSCHIK